MILLMSQYNDNSTIYVSHWLHYWNIPFFRIDLEDSFRIEKIELRNTKCEFVIENSRKEKLKISEVRAVWYRRGELNFTLPSLDFVKNKSLQNGIKAHLKMEQMVLEHFFYDLVREKPHIGTFQSRIVNKLSVLYQASRLGIKIPTSLICSSKQVLDLEFHKLNFLTKGIYEGFSIKTKVGNYVTYTENVLEEEIPEHFFPSLFQEGINKEADIRSFYLNGKFYSMAIRSQSNDQTITDFRKYIKGVGNRSFPFQLPKLLENKLDELMIKLELNTGSIDLIFTKKGEFVFLEVNPVGQFGMTSIPCNYNLEKLIAQTLKELANYE